MTPERMDEIKELVKQFNRKEVKKARQIDESLAPIQLLVQNYRTNLRQCKKAAKEMGLSLKELIQFVRQSVEEDSYDEV